MLLTRDNLLKFVRTQKYVTPTHVAKEFEVTTTIASAALSELVKDQSLKLTHIKYGTTPYYYDPRQKECLEEIASKTFSGNEGNLLTKLKEQQIISKNALTIPEQVIISKLQDIWYELGITHQGKEYIFYVWYMRDKNETLKQINEAIKGTSETPSPSLSKKTEKKEQKEESKKQEKTSNPFENIYKKSSSQQLTSKENNEKNSSQTLVEVEETDSRNKCDAYLQSHRFEIVEKEKHSLGNIYKTHLQVNGFKMAIDCLYIDQKKIQLKEIMEFYTSSMHPKYIFTIHVIPKKIEQVINELSNVYIIELK